MNRSGGNSPCFKHGFANRDNHHPLYSKWRSMKSRCYNKKTKGYKHYGARGITVCDEWKLDAGAFVKWGLLNGWVYGLEIDRINNDEGYSPENCRFVTRIINSNNKRRQKNSGRFIGVRLRRRCVQYTAQISHNGRNKLIGSFPSAIDAAVARDSYVINNSLGRRLNFPQPITEIL